MAIDLATIFGSEINVGFQPRVVDRQYSGFAGAHGLTAMHLGSRGHTITITGKLRASGANYTEARSTLGTMISVIEVYQNLTAADYIFMGNSFSSIVVERFQLIGGQNGKAFHFNSAGQVTCRFIMTGRSLV